MQTTITVRIKDVYGKETIYPVCPQAHLAAKVAKTKTLTRPCLATLKSMGFEVIVETPIYGRDMYYESVRL